MVDEKEKQQSKIVIQGLIREGKIGKSSSERILFFLQKSIESVVVAKRLFIISSDSEDSLKRYNEERK